MHQQFGRDDVQEGLLRGGRSHLPSDHQVRCPLLQCLLGHGQVRHARSPVHAHDLVGRGGRCLVSEACITLTHSHVDHLLTLTKQVSSTNAPLVGRVWGRFCQARQEGDRHGRPHGRHGMGWSTETTASARRIG